MALAANEKPRPGLPSDRNPFSGLEVRMADQQRSNQPQNQPNQPNQQNQQQTGNRPFGDRGMEQDTQQGQRRNQPNEENLGQDTQRDDQSRKRNDQQTNPTTNR
jgi:hypothetical protein